MSKIDHSETDCAEEDSFKALGLDDVLCEACSQLGWGKPFEIQRQAIPYALQDRDIIGLAETGSGKTGAFALPIIQALLKRPQRFFALVLTPTRELCLQITEQFNALGSSIGLKCVSCVGGLDKKEQEIALTKIKPHVVVSTPGRLLDHLKNTKGFNLKALKYLVMDEADRILNEDFKNEIDAILKSIPRERRTYLYSATMTSKVEKLERAALRDPVKLEVSSKYHTVETCKEHYIFLPAKYKMAYLVFVLNELAANSVMIFCNTCSATQEVALALRNLGLSAIPINGHMTQEKRNGAVNKFKSRSQSIIVATDVLSRGIDVPDVEVVVNFDLPTHSKNYVHRIGRTARAGKSGQAITLVTQYDVELFQRIEAITRKRCEEYKTEKDEVMLLVERVSDAVKFAKQQMAEIGKKKNGKRKYDDGEEMAGEKRQFKKPKKHR